MKIDWFMWIMVLLLMAAMALSLYGCSSVLKTEPPTIKDRIIYETITEHNWLVTAAILGVGAGFFSFLNGHSIGLKIIATCLVVLSLVISIATHWQWIALIATLFSVGFMAYTILIKHKALREIIKGIEEYKSVSPDIVADNAIFVLKNNLQNIQSPTTEKIVTKLKGKKK